MEQDHEVYNVPIFVEAMGLTINLFLTEAEKDRAYSDGEFLQELVDLELSKNSYQHTTETPTTDNGSVQESSASVPLIEPSNNATTLVAENESTLFIWSPACVHMLLALYEDRAHQFGSGTKRHNLIWSEIANAMADQNYKLTGAQCQSKLNGLKKTYKKILDHNGTSGNDRRTWPYFNKMNEIFGSTSWVQPRALASESGPSSATLTPPRKRKNSNLQKMCEEISERQSEREKKRKDRHDQKIEKMNQLLEQRESQHREKMELLGKLLDVFKK